MKSENAELRAQMKKLMEMLGADMEPAGAGGKKK